MKDICPYCEEKRELELISAKEKIEVRGESIEVDAGYYKCKTCGGEFDDPKSEHDPLEKAYGVYRGRHELLQPEEIKNFRKRYGLTQNELSRLLGWGLVTLSRYENGALQDEAHDKILRLAMEPSNLLSLIEKTPEALSDQKRQRIIEELVAEEEESLSFERIYEERFGKYEADEYSGYRKLNIAKLFNAILFFCKDGAFKTKVNKLLFYADFRHFKEYVVSITGSRYAHLPHGPTPDKYEHYFAALIESGAISIEECFCLPDTMGEKLVSTKTPDLSLFTDTEVKILALVSEYFKDFNASQIKEFSHDESGYKETNNGQLISYEYADQLKI